MSNNAKLTISVIIPCYNRQRSLRQALDSVLSQTHKPDEIIVIDDGSTDGSVEVAKSYGSKVQVIQQPNAGAAKARNRGIASATGDWIAFLDSDDIWRTEKLKRQIEAMQSNPHAGVIFCDTQTTSGEEVINPSRFSLGGLRENAEDFGQSILQCRRDFFEIMLTQSRVITSATMVRRDIAGFHFPEDIWGSEDWALWLSLILETEFLAVDDVLVTMEAASDNLTHSRGRGKLHRNDVRVLEKFLQDPRLTSREREATLDALEQRRAVAIYHSLIRGETRETRHLLKEPCALPFMSKLKYRILSHLPRPLVLWLGREKVTEANENAKANTKPERHSSDENREPPK